jgi:hypothetical protein
MTSGGVPIGSATVTYAINDAPTIPDTTLPGAMLAAASSTTDALGAAAIGVSIDARVGLASVFSLRATAGSAYADVTIIVADQSAGSVVVQPTFPNPDTPDRASGGINLRFFDNRRCADLDFFHPPTPPGKRDMVLPASGEKVTFKYVTTTKPAAVLGRASDGRGTLIALGCIDLPESTVLPDGVVEVALPLRDAVPNRRDASRSRRRSRFSRRCRRRRRSARPGATSATARWIRPSSCSDCIIDALSPETAADPLDCTPNTAAGGEGPLGDPLMARRGTLIANGSGVTACRGGRDQKGAPSLDAVALGLFGDADAAAAGDAADDRQRGPRISSDAFTLRSTLDLQATGRPDEYVVTHTLDSADFSPSTMPGTADIALVPLALPVLTAYTTANMREGLLIVNQHGFSLRLGRVARAGFDAAVLAPRLPAQAMQDTDG